MINFFDDTNSDNASAYESLFWSFPIENEENEESDCSPIIEDDNINNSNILQTVAKEPINTTNLNLDGTNDVTKEKLNLNYPLKALAKIGNFTHFCSLNSIRGILVNKIGDIDNDIITKIVKDEYVAKAEEYLNPIMKININNEKEDMNQNDNIVYKGNTISLGSAKIEITENNLLKKKRGRKTENTGGKEHNRFSGDNIIKKIKAIFFNNYHEFINLMINEYYNKDKKEKILKIEYKNIDNLKKDYNLELLKKPLKYSFSLDVSDKYRSKKENKDYNAKIIKEIIDPKKYTEIEDYNTIKFILDISLTDWIDLFTYKKDISTLADEYHASDINIGKIQDNFIGAIDLLNDIPKDSKEDQIYYSLFIIYLFNFQRWFWIKKGRNVEKKKIE
jgi:hypothetical protein